jgi:DNA recombination-dependent growth factor C
MGLLNGKGTAFIKFKVGDHRVLPSGDFYGFAEEAIRNHAFRDIDDNYDEISAGWVSVNDMLDGEFDNDSWRVGDYLLLSLRVDERKVPAATLKKLVLKETKRIQRERQIPRLSRDHQNEIKEMVRLNLLKRAVPQPAVYDMAWDLNSGILLFFSTSANPLSALEQIFHQTFGVHIVQQVPYLLAQRFAPTEEDLVASLTPSNFI